MTAAEFLARAHAVTDAATPGPWEYAADTLEILDPDGGIALMTWPGRNTPNAAFIAASRTMLPAAVAALDAVLAEVATFESLVRDDIGDAGIPAWGDGYLRGYHDAALDIRERIAAVLDGTS